MTIDELRKSIERRLAELADDAERLKAALAPLDAGASPPAPSSPKVTRSSPPADRQAPKPRRRRPQEAQSTRATVAARGATRQAVLDALSDGSAMTAGDIATATGLSRGSVSTTLSGRSIG